MYQNLYAKAMSVSGRKSIAFKKIYSNDEKTKGENLWDMLLFQEDRKGTATWKQRKQKERGNKEKIYNKYKIKKIKKNQSLFTE